MVKKIRAKIKRKPGSTGIQYFSDDTQNAIMLFQGENSHSIKNEIYLRKIQPALDSLVENLILVYGFKSPHDTFEDLSQRTTSSSVL